jgi:two-component sensor histidine kinase
MSTCLDDAATGSRPSEQCPERGLSWSFAQPQTSEARVFDHPNGVPGASLRRLLAGITLDSHPTSARRAREFVEERLGEAEGFGRIDDAVLLTSELVTNAVVHAHSPVLVSLAVDTEHVVVSVYDDSDEPPVRRQPASVLDTSRRGLQLVEAIATSWAFQPTERGKRVWFELSMNG